MTPGDTGTESLRAAGEAILFTCDRTSRLLIADRLFISANADRGVARSQFLYITMWPALRPVLSATEPCGLGRPRSIRELVARVGIVIEECDESQFWLELLEPQTWSSALAPLTKNADELMAIFVASRKTAEKGANKGKETTIGNRQ
jgi:hypothetical protein